MNLGRWLLKDLLSSVEIDGFGRRLGRASHAAPVSSSSTHDEIVQLRADVARIALLTRSLADLCIERGVLTPGQLKEKMLALDLTDGREDGRMDLRDALDG
jgi:hypothetical protein